MIVLLMLAWFATRSVRFPRFFAGFVIGCVASVGFVVLMLGGMAASLRVG